MGLWLHGSGCSLAHLLVQMPGFPGEAVSVPAALPHLPIQTAHVEEPPSMVAAPQQGYWGVLPGARQRRAVGAV